MYSRFVLPTLAALTLAAAPAHAQRAATGAATRALAVYRLAAPERLGLPAEVTVADSAGDVVASFHTGDDRTMRPMVVGMIDDGLVLQGETSRGILTMVLYPEDSTTTAAPTARRRVIGEWSLGARHGRLYARTRA